MAETAVRGHDDDHRHPAVRAAEKILTDSSRQELPPVRPASEWDLGPHPSLPGNVGWAIGRHSEWL